MDPAIIGAIGSVIGGAGSLASAFTRSPGAKFNVGKQLRYNEASGYQASHFKRIEQDWDAKNFKRYANEMGVNKLALLGNQPTYSPRPMQLTARERPSRSDVGGAIRNMGQDVKRGVQQYMALQEHKAVVDKTQAETGYYNALSASVRNQMTQEGRDSDAIKESNLPSDYAIYDKQLADRGVSREDQPTITKQDFIAHYPSQEIMDYISESHIGAGLYYKGKAGYLNAMTKGSQMRKASRHKDPIYNAYLKEKNELEWRVGRKIMWNRNAKRWMILRK